MIRVLVLAVLGAVLLGLGIWWWTIVGPSFAFLGPIVVQGLGGALIVSAIAVLADMHSPTSRKLQ